MLNKAILVPIALLLSYFLPFLIMPLLMLGGAYLCYEGFEKVWHNITDKAAVEKHKELLRKALEDPKINLAEFEKDKIKGAIRTDFILSAEIIIIALGTIADKEITTQISVLVFVAILMTVGVYGLVAGIVKIDDGGLALVKDKSTSLWGKLKRILGQFMISFAPKLMKFLAIAGTAAMWLVGGSLITHGVHAMHSFIIMATEFTAKAPVIGTLFASATPLLIDLIVGFVLGALIVFIEIIFKKLAKS
jgi:predicted DNA repair protein MutK